MVSEIKHDYYFDNFVSPKTFIQQIRYLKRKFNIISLNEAIERARTKSDLKNCLCITFDDGFFECYSLVAPILYDEKITATFFLIENTIDNKDLMWRNKLWYIENHIPCDKRSQIFKSFTQKVGIDFIDPMQSLLKTSFHWKMGDKDRFADRLWKLANLETFQEWIKRVRPYMTKSQIKELVNNGFSIGSHSKSHPRCDKLNSSELWNEIVGSLSGINKQIGIDVDLFSYPFGIRPSKEEELKIIEESSVKCLLGIKSRLANYHNPYQWERDRMDMEFTSSIVKLFLRPLKYKFLTK